MYGSFHRMTQIAPYPIDVKAFNEYCERHPDTATVAGFYAEKRAQLEAEREVIFGEMDARDRRLDQIRDELEQLA